MKVTHMAASTDYTALTVIANNHNIGEEIIIIRLHIQAL